MGDGIREAVLFQFTFPDYNHIPTLGLQLPPYFLVPFLIPPHLRHPEISVGFGDSVILAAFMTMPETAMNEDDCFVFWKNNVGRTGEVLIIHPIPKTLFPKSMTQLHLRLRIGGVNSCHILVALGRYSSIRH